MTVLSREILKKYDVSGPRYTSYPPVPYFDKNVSVANWEDLLREEKSEEISLYVHIPFCPRRCLYCGCNTEISNGKDLTKIQAYCEAVIKEIQEMGTFLQQFHGFQKKCTHIHFGGGTPNGIPLYFISEILNQISQSFVCELDTGRVEVAMEWDPTFTSTEQLEMLKEMGVTRISFGVQDFHRDVLKAVQRGIPKISIEVLVKKVRKLGIQGVNLDLMYGLPKQTMESFQENINKVIEIGPDRISVFSYAHVPSVQPHQKALEQYAMPNADEKLTMAIYAYDKLTAAGYVAVGMDHFAKPNDSLAQALREKKLHRNFQGYCDGRLPHNTYAFGASGISQLSSGYAQNLKNVQDYVDAVEQDKWPLEKMFLLNTENVFYKKMIWELMCQQELDLQKYAAKKSLSLDGFLAEHWEAVQTMNQLEEEGLVKWCKTRAGFLQVTEKGRYVVRYIAMAWDPMYQQEKKGTYSKVL